MQYGYASPLLGLRTADAVALLAAEGIAAELRHSEAPRRREGAAPCTERVVRAEGDEAHAVLTVCAFPDGVSAR